MESIYVCCNKEQSEFEIISIVPAKFLEFEKPVICVVCGKFDSQSMVKRLLEKLQDYRNPDTNIIKCERKIIDDAIDCEFMKPEVETEDPRLKPGYYDNYIPYDYKNY